MSSELIVKVQKIYSIKEHGNADALEVCVLGIEGGWEVVIKKNTFKAGDLVVFVPPDALMPRALADMLGITKYLGELPASSIERAEGFLRVKAANLRGRKSFGTILTADDVANYLYQFGGGLLFADIHWEEGKDVADILGIKKWIPKEKVLCGEATKAVSWFHTYTNIQNIKNHPGLFKDGEIVVISEKIHGTNCRVGLASDPDNDGKLNWMAGSHTVQRKELDAEGRKSKYWQPLDNQQLRAMIEELAKANNPSCFSVIVFGEIYGAGIQDMNYGLVGKTGFRVFDIAINGNYMNWDDVVSVCHAHNIELVPELYRGPYSLEVIEQYTDGPTTLATPDLITCKFKGREGIVAKTLVERFEPELNGRMILKSVSVDYLERKGATDNA